MDSSTAPSVTSPPNRCAIGNRMNIAACAAAKVSKRSPSTTTRSGARRANASANPMVPIPTDLATPVPESLLNSDSTVSSTAKPSSRIWLMVVPNSGDRCIPVATSCSFSPAVCWIARIGQTSRPKSARLPVTKQILRTASAIVGLYAGAARQIDQAAFDRFGDAQIAARACREHRKPVHQRPHRAGAKTGGAERGQHVVAQAGMGFVEQDRVEPVVAGRSLRLAREADAGDTGKNAIIGGRQRALSCEEAVDLLELGAAQCGVQIGQAIIEADFIMHEGPFVRQFCGGRDVLGAATEFLVVGQDRAAAAGGDDLVAVETQRGETGFRADRMAFVGRSERLGGVLDDRNVPVPGDRGNAVH